ncbi:MAG: hypothetical protein DDG60_03140 [Anaerolineae bacterium]|nr:MAG: hypothetical protein DDG60_03140 [Anaerolineae bacterium]
MKLWQRILLAMLVAFLALSVALPASARGADDPSPLPGWLSWLLSLVGLAPPTPTPTAPPPPSVTEYRISSLETLEGLPALLQPGKKVRAYASAADVEAMVSAYLATPRAAKNGLLSGKVTLLDGAVKVEGAVSRAFIEKQGVPVFVNGDVIAVEGQGSIQAVDCLPQISLTSARMGGISVPLTGLLAQLLNDALREEWPAGICLENVTITSQEISAQGYRK